MRSWENLAAEYHFNPETKGVVFDEGTGIALSITALRIAITPSGLVEEQRTALLQLIPTTTTHSPAP